MTRTGCVRHRGAGCCIVAMDNNAARLASVVTMLQADKRELLEERARLLEERASQRERSAAAVSDAVRNATQRASRIAEALQERLDDATAQGLAATRELQTHKQRAAASTRRAGGCLCRRARHG